MPNKPFQVTHSIPSAEELLAQIRQNFDIGPISECRYWQIGLNDTYMLIGPERRFVLRVYRAKRRMPSDIEYELDALTYLSSKGVLVSTPVLRNDGTRITVLEAPEGRRYYVLFMYADGATYSYGEDIRIAFEYGKAVARIHNAMDDFESGHKRFTLDLDFLIRNPIEHIRPFLKHRPTDWDYLRRLAERIEKNVLRLSRDGLDHGFCHGDTNGYNAHRTIDGQINFFDFDFCGIGWRAYELASFRWLAIMNPKEERWSNFLSGYAELRPLHDIDLKAVPFLVGARQIWIDGMQIENGPDWGFSNIDDAYFDRKLNYLRSLENSYLE